MIAKVIINHDSKNVDKEYDYYVSDDMAQQLKPGMRVRVPFGKADNVHEAYVMSLSESSRIKSLKSIAQITDTSVLLSADMLELAKWMKIKYIASYISVLKTILPTGTDVKYRKILSVNKYDEEAQKTVNRSPIKSEIVDIIKESGNKIELNRLMQKFNTNISSQIKSMLDDGILSQEICDVKSVNDKYVCMAQLCVSHEQAMEALTTLNKNAKIQSRVLKLLIDNHSMCLADLVDEANASYTAVHALKEKGFIELKETQVYRYTNAEPVNAQNFDLTHEQTYAVRCLKNGLESGKAEKYLLHGVTGSGKTQVFIEAARHAVSMGRKVIVMVPEISITSQIVKRFRQQFGNRIAVYHSGLSLGERYDEWKKAKNNEVDIVIGTRSAVFAPFDNIGMIILDEEHEQTYKSETMPRYHAREVAEKRCEQNGSVLLLASATPSVDSYYKAQTGEYKLLEMTQRYNNMPLPEIEIVDMRKELENGNRSIFSKRLYDEIKYNLEHKEQTILFLNKRGFSSFVSCRSCGFIAKCPNCDITLTYHKTHDSLMCHYCGHTVDNYKTCPSCGSPYIRYYGGGTQKVEEEIHRLFPSATCIRMDVDTTSKKSAHEQLIHTFETENTDVLIGTQMITKGLDFSNVTLVGAVLADTSLYIDDFRSCERTFALLEQVSGRAGRAGKKGRAVIQTYQPESDAIQSVKQHDYHKLYETEIAMREALWYPPFSDIVFMQITGTNLMLVSKSANHLAKMLNAALFDILKGRKIHILGPVASHISKTNNRYRYNIILKCVNADDITDFLSDMQIKWYADASNKNLTLSIDKNPNSMY